STLSPDDGTALTCGGGSWPASGASCGPSPGLVALPAAVTAPAAGAPAPAALGLGSGLVDDQGATAGVLAVEGRDGGLGLLVAAHLNEAEPLGMPRVAVGDDLRRLHRAVRPEQLLQVGVGDAETQVAHEQLPTHERSPKKAGGASQPPEGGSAPQQRAQY